MRFSLLLLLSTFPLVSSRYRKNQLERFWIDPATIAENLENYEALYIKPHGCVWSECTVDDVSEYYVGDYRDGDEQWYQYRTQGFCANAAYSVYGIKKQENWFSRHATRGCSKGHFINSFFTYGGSDTLLKAIGMMPYVYYDPDEYEDVNYNDGDDNGQNNNNNDRRRLEQEEDYEYNNEDQGDDAKEDYEYNYYQAGNGDDDDNGNDDYVYQAANGDDDDDAVHYNKDNEYIVFDDSSYYEKSENAICVAIDEEENDGGDGEDEGRRRRDRRQRRKLSSEDENGGGDGLVSTLGCDAKMNYIIASFESDTCDGNYFKEAIDTFDDYNDQFDSVGCRRLWSSSEPDQDYGLTYLFNNSWSCDTDLYPNGCPDPYGLKLQYEYALRVYSEGGNANLAYSYLIMTRPARVLGWIFFALAVLVFMKAYEIKNRERIGSKGGKFVGYVRCVCEDLHTLMIKLFALLGMACMGCGNRLRARLEKAKRRVAKRKKLRNSKSRKDADEKVQDDTEKDNDYVTPDEDEINYVRTLASTSA